MTRPPILRDLELVDAAVPTTASFLDAARALYAARLSALAVVDAERRVAGLFTDDDLLRGLFPGYLENLRHTAFLEAETSALSAQVERSAAVPVVRHVQRPMTVDVGASEVHVAERFLHCPWGALAVVERERFVGMVEQVAFSAALMTRLGIVGLTKEH